MIKAEQVPKEAYAAAAELLAEGARTDQAIAAALNAWPKSTIISGWDTAYGWQHGRIILPLTQESDNA